MVKWLVCRKDSGFSRQAHHYILKNAVKRASCRLTDNKKVGIVAD
jgi:hypothetical protein